MSAARMRLTKLIQHAGKWKKPNAQEREAAKKKRWNILRGDKVQVIGRHPESGKQGIVMEVLRKKGLLRTPEDLRWGEWNDETSPCG